MKTFQYTKTNFTSELLPNNKDKKEKDVTKSKSKEWALTKIRQTLPSTATNLISCLVTARRTRCYRPDAALYWPKVCMKNASQQKLAGRVRLDRLNPSVCHQNWQKKCFRPARLWFSTRWWKWKRWFKVCNNRFSTNLVQCINLSLIYRAGFSHWWSIHLMGAQLQQLVHLDSIFIFNLTFHLSKDLDSRRYNAPTAQEIAAVFTSPDGTPPVSNCFAYLNIPNKPTLWRPKEYYSCKQQHYSPDPSKNFEKNERKNRPSISLRQKSPDTPKIAPDFELCSCKRRMCPGTER